MLLFPDGEVSPGSELLKVTRQFNILDIPTLFSEVQA